MYRLIGSLSKLGMPIVFKGALVLKVIQAQYGNPSGLVRETKDIDGDWVGESPTMEYLTCVMKKAVLYAGYSNIIVEKFRDYGDKKSAGFKFYLSDRTLFASMDLSVKANPYSVAYSYVDGIYFNGQSIYKTLADKISVVTSRKIVRRIKDMLDIYIISYMFNGSYNDIVRVMKESGREIGGADTLYGCIKELEHAYDVYKNSAKVLRFDEVYTLCCRFTEPFIRYHNSIEFDLFWIPQHGWVRR